MSKNNPILVVSTPSATASPLEPKPKWTPPNPTLLNIKFKKELLGNTKKYLVLKGMKKFHFSNSPKIIFENYSLPIFQSVLMPKPEDFKNWIVTNLYVPVDPKANLYHVKGKKTGNERVGVEVPSEVTWEISVPNFIPSEVRNDLKDHILKHFNKMFTIVSQKENTKTGKKRAFHSVNFIPTAKGTDSYLYTTPFDGSYESSLSEDVVSDIITHYSILLTNKNYSFTDVEPDSNNSVRINFEKGTVSKNFGKLTAKEEYLVPF